MGHTINWFITGSARDRMESYRLLNNRKEVKAFNPDAVIVPGNVVPDYWPGLKVQIFHGLGEEKRGHYRITNFFDLYCTPGPFLTKKFEELALRNQTFLVKETGWPKMDQLKTNNQTDRKLELGFTKDEMVILYAPTFSPRYTSAETLFSAIRELVHREDYRWLVKFHPLMDQKWIERYKEISGERLRIMNADDIFPLMEASDLLLTDTSSVAYEYLLLDRPIITFSATARHDKGIDINYPEKLASSIQESIRRPEAFHDQRKAYLEELHPYSDSRSAERVLKTIEKVLDSEELKQLKVKKPNWFQKRQIRKWAP